MKNITIGTMLTKRQKFVLSIAFFSLLFFLIQPYSDLKMRLGFGIGLAILTVLTLFLILRQELKDTFFYPLLIFPFLYTLSFDLFYALVPPRLIARLIITILYAFGLYSLFLAQNIFVVSASRTINLLRSARVVSFILSLVVFFFFMNIIFSLHLPIFITPLIIFTFTILLNYYAYWIYTLDKKMSSEVFSYSLCNSLVISELSLVLLIWPVNATIYSIFLTGIFYTYSGLSHAWLERRLFKGILWEYVWVGFLSILILLFFARWGI